MTQQYRLGVDIGGTFTDFVLMGDDGTYVTKKLLSTPHDYSEAVLEGVKQLLEDRKLAPSTIVEIVHGTTVATNAVLERKGAKTGLITTKGFRDVLEIRRMTSPAMHDNDWDKPLPLVPRRSVCEVSERMTAQGEVLIPLQEREVKGNLKNLVDQGVEALAVCLINSYVNPAHEQEIATLARKSYPHLSICISADILAEVKEYERTSTAVTNAYVMPVMSSYIQKIVERLATLRVNAPLYIMQSNGGIMTSDMAARKPVFALESGPAAGVIAALHLAKSLGFTNCITFDMGGTTAKASIIENGQLNTQPEYEVGAPISLGSRLVKGGGYLLRVPSVDIAEVGAGGGTIASVDTAGSLRVGPRSTGAMPGPACYDRGGTDPTVTDSNMVLGYINPEYLLGGEMKVDYDKGYKAVEEKVARPLGMSAVEAAYGVHLIVNANMTRAIRAVSTERGRDVRDFALVAFGGNGPVHAGELAKAAGMRTIIIPNAPGVFSSFGLLFADIEHSFIRSLPRRQRHLSAEDMLAVFHQMEQEATKALGEDTVRQGTVQFLRYADLEYEGQSYPLTVSVASGKVGQNELQKLKDDFEAEHLRQYGRKGVNEPIEVVNLRVVARVLRTRQGMEHLSIVKQRDGRGTGTTPRRAYFGRDFGTLSTPVVRRADLGTKPTEGPLIVEEYDTTIVVPPLCTARRDNSYNIVVELK